MRDNQLATTGIVLSRVDYGEGDRIVNFITPDHGKIGAVAKGVRRGRSKLAGGVELFSVSELTFLKGRTELQTLISARLIKHFGTIVQSLERTQWAYDVLKNINKISEYVADKELYDTLYGVLEALNDPEMPLAVIELWYDMQLLKIQGNQPNLITDAKGDKLRDAAEYSFDLEHMSFFEKEGGGFLSSHIKLLRLALSNPPEVLRQIQGIGDLLPPSLKLADAMSRQQAVF